MRLDLLNTQINNILNGIHSVAGVMFRVSESSYRAANASDIASALLNGTLTEAQKKSLRDALGISRTGFRPRGHVNSTSSLPTTGNQLDDCYSVGSSTPYSIYVWDGSTWINMGQMSTSVIWGNVSGTLSNQTDLSNALANKQDKLNLTGILKGNGTSGVGTTTIGENDIQNGAIKAAKIDSNAVTAEKIQSGAVSIKTTATLSASGWSALAESGAGYIQTVSAANLLSSDTEFFCDVDVTTVSPSTDAQRVKIRKAWGKVYDVLCNTNGQLTVKIQEMPTVDMAVSIIIVRK